MNTRSAWLTALAVYVAYNGIIFATWRWVGADYTRLSEPGRIATNIVLPLVLGAVFMALVVTTLGWWAPAWRDATPAASRWTLPLVLLPMAAAIAANLSTVSWSTVAPSHIAWLAAGAVLVGFNEELLARGVLVTGLRRAGANERAVWLGSSLLFGAMHLPNALFGLPPVNAMVQCGLAFVVGGAFYVLRRTSGVVWLPMLMHGSWDFSTFSLASSGGPTPWTVGATLLTHVVAVVAVIGLLRADRGSASGRAKGQAAG